MPRILSFQPSSYITVGSWHMDGRQFMTGHYDGGLSTWNIKNAKKPEDRQLPHGKLFHYI